jgi:putative membrane protein
MALLRPLFAIGANALGLWLCNYFLTDFFLDGEWVDLAIMALVLTLLNFLLKPILKLLLGPVIILTLGLGLSLVNAFMLYLLDLFFENLSILVIPDLLYAALIVGFINFVFHSLTK